MRFHRAAALLICLGVFSSFFLLGVPSEAEVIESKVNASVDINFITATDFFVSVTMSVFQISVFDTLYDTAEIQAIAATDPETMGAIKLRIRDVLKNQLETTFQNSEVTALNQKPSYGSSQFQDEFSINLTSAFFGLNTTVDAHNFINGLLDMDAIVFFAFVFQAEAGWNNTYAIVLPESMIFRNTTGKVSGSRITWDVKNWNGELPSVNGRLSLQFVTPTTPKSESEDISLQFDLDASNVQNTTLRTTLNAISIDLEPYDVIPSFITNINIVPADGIRLFIDNELIQWEDVYQTTFNPLENLIKSTIETSSFNQTLETIFNWDAETTTNASSPYDISSMDMLPPVKATFTDEDVTLKFLEITSKALFGLVNAGATGNLSATDINFGDKLDTIGLPYTGRLYLPTNITLGGKNIYNWNSTHLLSGEIISERAPEYTDENIQMRVDIDITQMDLSLASFFTGTTELSAATQAREEIELYATSIPEEFYLPEKLILPYLNSDAFRICVEEHVFTEADLTNYLTNRKTYFETRASSILPGLNVSGVIDRTVFSDSLNWDGDISSMDGISPVRVSTYANSLHSVPFSLSIIPPGFNISDLQFNLAGLEDREMTYRIVFPKGISVEATDLMDKAIVTGETEAGAQYIELTFEANETTEVDIVTCKVSASTLYVLGLFLPCILTFILVIVLIIVVLIIRKKRKKSKPVVHEEEPVDFDGYEGQDYYVPPPPGSK